MGWNIDIHITEMKQANVTLKSSISRMRGSEVAEEDFEVLSVLVASVLSFI